MSDPNIEAQVKVAAYFCSQKGMSYNDLCWKLAETTVKIRKGKDYTQEDVKRKSKEIFNEAHSYDDLCWLIAELEIFEKENLFPKK